MLTFLHDKNQWNVYFINVFRNSANALLQIFSIEFHFIFGSYSILLVRLGKSLGGPHVLTLFIRFYYISDDINLGQWRAVIGIFNCRSSAISYHVCN